jgi:hypothetical protein
MAFGFPAYHEERVRYKEPPDELMDAVDAALAELHWSGRQSGRWRFTASTGVSFWSWGEGMTIDLDLDDGELFVRSQCSFPTQCIDWGRNHNNVRKFLDALDRALEDGARRRARRLRDREERASAPRRQREEAGERSQGVRRREEKEGYRE